MSDPEGTEASRTPSADGKSSASAAPWERSESEQLLDELIFKQDLNEVHLLIDFVSGRSDRSLSTLAMPNPHKDQQYPNDTLSASEIVMRIAQMRYPPNKDDAVVNSQNAAILLMAKDRLSTLASPARGLTIAYTAMFIGAEGSWAGVVGSSPQRRWWTSRRAQPEGGGSVPGERAARLGPENPGPVTSGHRWAGPPESRDSRIDLASQTVPGLQRNAWRFRKWRDWLIWFSMLWVLLTALTYWDVALGRSVLQRLDQFWKTRSTMLQATPELLNQALCPPYQAGQATPPPSPTDEEAKKIAGPCRALWSLDRSRADARTDLERAFRCEGLSRTVVPLHLWCWSGILSGGIEPEPGHVNWQSAASVLSVFTTYILPMMFALLGTLICAFRNIHDRVRDSTLAPRHLVGMKLGIPMGLVAGIAVGLFFSPSAAPVQGGTSVAGELSLTPSGLGFLAGYGCQPFFRFIDDLLERVFPENAPAKPSAPQPEGHK